MNILVVANKSWECEPLVNALLCADARPRTIDRDSLRLGYHPAEVAPLDPDTKRPYPLPEEADGLPTPGHMPPRPRLSFTAGPRGAAASVEVWCIEDWMRRSRKDADGAVKPLSSSSSYEKFTFTLPLIRRHAFGVQQPDLVVAFGTAGIPSLETLNGCVTIGSRVYLRDAWEGASADELREQVERFGPLLQHEVADFLKKRLDSPVSGQLFRALDPELRHSAEARFLTTPVHPAVPPRILAGHGFASLGTLNICDYDDYVWADAETMQQFETHIRQREIGSMETTHGLIRLTFPDTPFLFVSGLTDRVPLFNSEVTPRLYAQNHAAAHNAGVATAFLLPELARLQAEGGLRK